MRKLFIFLLLPFFLGIFACQKDPSNAAGMPSGRSAAPDSKTAAKEDPISASAAKEDPAEEIPAAVEEYPLPEPGERDYPWWRGPDRNDIVRPGISPPQKWGEDQNIVWKTPLPGLGYGTPTLIGDRIYLPAAEKVDEDSDLYSVSILVLSRSEGKILIKKELMRGKGAKPIHRDNSNASATIASDGERLFYPLLLDGRVYFFCCDMEGKILWKKDLGPFKSVHGYSTSPLLYKHLAILCIDPEAPGQLAAFDRKTGRLVWKVVRTVEEANFSSPALIHSSGKDQVVLTGPFETRSYDPNTGKLIWFVDGPSRVCPASPAWDDQTVYLSSGFPHRIIMAVKTNGQGKLDESSILWKKRKDPVSPYVPSMILKDGLLFAATDEGSFSCIDAKTGDLVWTDKLGERVYSSPVLVGDLIYLFGRKGTGWIYRADRKKDRIAENKLGSGVWATPVITSDGIYLRSVDTLYKIAPKSK
ncbi:MAG: PQQ-binding-like beta-propeller repeat protein [Planctomycetia bacterium]|nr:PQQ-binding-like beta-propeller repeat protein [Planctomycetia bacterium]